MLVNLLDDKKLISLNSIMLLYKLKHSIHKSVFYVKV